MISKNLRIKIIFLLIFFLGLPLFVSADYIAQRVNFFIDPSYDLEKREKISATLREISSHAYFYIDDKWWDSLNGDRKNTVISYLDSLSAEFDSKIYPTLTSTFGSEPRPGIDGDGKITVLIHPMIKEAGGYFNSGDSYSKFQNPKSNEREMIYFNAEHIEKSLAKSLLAHEFVHLITFNQKEKIRNITEETWLDEGRAEYAPTLLGYDEIYEGSNLQRRIKDFLEKPTDSLTEWRNEKYDYGVVNLFVQYLVDHYGLEILVDSLHSSKVGILSINEALLKNGLDVDFAQIFTDWTIALLVGDCSLGQKYCYSNQNLKDIRVNPLINFLPLIGESSLSINFITRDWAGNWHKIVGGKGTLIFEFDGADEVTFVIPYLVCDIYEKCQIEFLTLDQNQKGEILLPEFNRQYRSLTIIPSIQTKISGFNSMEKNYLFFWRVSVIEETKPEEESELIKNLLAQIEELKKEIARVQAEINAILGKPTCQRFERNLYYGMMDSFEIRCLQEFLTSQGSEIYPEGLVTGNFLSLTQAAIIRFQEKYSEEILKPLDLERGTGFFGPKTRAKVNQLWGY